MNIKIPVAIACFLPGRAKHPGTMGTGFFPGVKRPGRGVDHSPSSGAEVKERVKLFSTTDLCDLL